MRTVLKWIKRIFFGVLTLIVFVLVVGFIYEHITRSIDAHKIKPTGEFVNVGDHQLHYLKKGSGAPTVVFESGLETGGHLPWEYVQDEISKYATTISYDRAGILWSERGNDPKSLSAITSDLYNLLQSTDCPEPYILVGHSYAGVTLRKFIDEQKNNITGLVFVDVSHPDQMNRFSDEMKAMMKFPPRWILKTIFNCGINHILPSESYPNTSKHDSINIIGNKFTYKGLDALYEMDQNDEVLSLEASAITNFDSLPLIIITGTSEQRWTIFPDEELNIEGKKVWAELQKDLLNLSSNSKQIFANESGHYVQLEQPEIVIEAIESMLNQDISENE